MLVGMVKLDILGRQGIVIFKMQSYGAVRNRQWQMTSVVGHPFFLKNLSSLC